jgi:hypothetical protein
MRKLVHSSLYWGKVVVLGIIVGVGIQFAEAWTNPSVSAPGGNVAGPINTGVFDQVKNASLGLIGNLASGLVQLNTVVVEGTACPSNGLVGRDSIGRILACQSLIWTRQNGGGSPVWVYTRSSHDAFSILTSNPIPFCYPTSQQRNSRSSFHYPPGDWHYIFTYTGTGRCPTPGVQCVTDSGPGRGYSFYIYTCTAL